MNKKNINRLSRRLSLSMMAGLRYHGGFMIAFPFIFFAAYAAEDIRASAVCMAVIATVAALWFCTWDFVRVAVKRGSEPFCAVWLKIMSQDTVPQPEGDNAPRGYSYMPAAKGLFFLRLGAAAVWGVAGLALSFYAGMPWPMAFALALLLWVMVERFFAGAADAPAPRGGAGACGYRGQGRGYSRLQRYRACQGPPISPSGQRFFCVGLDHLAVVSGAVFLRSWRRPARRRAGG